MLFPLSSPDCVPRKGAFSGTTRAQQATGRPRCGCPNVIIFWMCHDVDWLASSETEFKSNLQGALPSVLGSCNSQSLRVEMGGSAREEDTGSQAPHYQVFSTYLSAPFKNWSFGLLGQSSPLLVAWQDRGCCLSTFNTGLPPGAPSPTSSATSARLQKAEQAQGDVAPSDLGLPVYEMGG